MLTSTRFLRGTSIQAGKRGVRKAGFAPSPGGELESRESCTQRYGPAAGYSLRSASIGSIRAARRAARKQARQDGTATASAHSA